jgi:hypothetical protein
MFFLHAAACSDLSFPEVTPSLFDLMGEVGGLYSEIPQALVL